MRFRGRLFRVAALLTAGAAQGAIAAEGPAAVEPFGLGRVHLLDGPFKAASERNARYLLSLDADRLLHNTRKYAGLEPKGELYGGWESKGIAGHTLGHYLTALSQQYAASGDGRFRERIDYIVSEMAVAQEAYGDGYVGALPPLELATLRALREAPVEPENPFVFRNGAWVPWYTQHKILAGLRDAWVTGGSDEAKGVTLRLADWVGYVTENLSEAQIETMLRVEHGGMLEVLLDLYARTGNERYLETSRRFRHRAILDPLRAGRDELAGRHANTQIPKIAGAARSFEVTGDTGDRDAALTFWDRVVHEHSWVIGGNSEGEHFFEPDTAASHLTAATAESCNTYNMLKLTEHLFRWEPSVEYADYYERALYNHILASAEPRRGMFAYFMSLAPGHFRTYSTPGDSFWCCVGSGMENHTKYGKAIYFHDRDRLFVNLFIPSVLEWPEKGVEIVQRGDYPRDDRVEILWRRAPAERVDLEIRAPAWAHGPLSVSLNGETLRVAGKPGRFVSIDRVWRRGDRLTVRIPMAVRTEPLRGTTDTVAFLYGPVVLAGDLGAVGETATFPYAEDQAANFEAPRAAVPALTGPPDAAASRLRRLGGPALAFRTRGTIDGRARAVTLRPFAELPYRYYNVYWRLAEPADGPGPPRARDGG